MSATKSIFAEVAASNTMPSQYIAVPQCSCRLILTQDSILPLLFDLLRVRSTDGPYA